MQFHTLSVMTYYVHLLHLNRNGNRKQSQSYKNSVEKKNDFPKFSDKYATILQRLLLFKIPKSIGSVKQVMIKDPISFQLRVRLIGKSGFRF